MENISQKNMKPLKDEYEDRGIDFREALPIIEIYRNFRRRVRNSLSTHHIIPSEKGGADTDMNKRRMIHREHEGLHDYLGNEITHQKLRQIITDDQTVLKPGFVGAVDELLDRYERKGMIYEKGVWRPR